VLNSPEERIAAGAARDFICHAELLDALGVDFNAKIVTHVGGVYGEREAAADRFVRHYQALPQNVRDRLVLENDEVSWSVDDVLKINRRTGVPLVFDNLHHAVNNPSNMPAHEALRAMIATWPNDQKPKIHFSSQRREERRLSRRDRATGHVQEVTAKAKPGQHDDWIDVTEFITLLDGANDLQFDVMLEAKQKQLALLRLREDLAAASRGELAW
jgi:UV DNA damage endonuclease